MRETLNNGYYIMNKHEKTNSFDKGFCSTIDITHLNRKTALKHVFQQRQNIQQNGGEVSFSSKNILRSMKSEVKTKKNESIPLNLNQESLNHTLKTLKESRVGKRKNIAPIMNKTNLLNTKKKFPLRKDLILCLQAGRLPSRSKTLSRTRLMPNINLKLLRIKQIEAQPLFKNKKRIASLFGSNKNNLEWKPIRDEQHLNLSPENAKKSTFDRRSKSISKDYLNFK